MLDGAPLTPNDGPNCVFQSFRKNDETGLFDVPYELPQSRVSQAGLFASPVENSGRTIHIPDITRIAYFVDGSGETVQPIGPTWADAQPRLLLDLANPETAAASTGSSIIIVLPAPGTTRKRPTHIIVDHRLRHPLNAHATGDVVSEPSMSAAALQTWHANVDDQWIAHGNERYPALGFWAAGVSERNRENRADLAQSWGSIRMPQGHGGSQPTSLFALASNAGDKMGGPFTLEGMLRGVTWRRADRAGRGIPAVDEIGIRPNGDTPPIRGFGLQRVAESEHYPRSLVPVLSGDFPIETRSIGSAKRALKLPSGFSITPETALKDRRPFRAIGTSLNITPGSPIDWLAIGSPVQWNMSLEIAADALDRVPTSSGEARPLEALRDLLATRAQARAIARGMPPFSFAPQFSGSPGFNGALLLTWRLTDSLPWARAIGANELSLDNLQAEFRLSGPPGRAIWPALSTHSGNALAGGKFYNGLSAPIEEQTSLDEDLGEVDSTAAGRFLAKRIALRITATASDRESDTLRIGSLDLEMRRLVDDAPYPTGDPCVFLTLVPAISLIGGQRGLRVRIVGSFPVAAARPARTDRPPVNRDMASQSAQLEDAPDLPVLLPLSTASSIGIQGWLKISESFGWGLDPQLTMRLALNGSIDMTTVLESFLLFGRIPMQVARLQMPPLARRADPTDYQVAVWSSGAETGGSWRLRDPQEAALIILGPQGVGEAMEKGCASDGYNDIGVDERAAYRFTPPAILEIDPSPLDSGFVEPSWNLDRIFGRPGVIEPGARLKRAAYELFYGMAGALNDRGLKNGQLRLSDVAARYGVPPSRMSRSASVTDAALGEWIDEWNSLRRVTFTRPLTLSASRTDRLAGFEVEGSGVDFRLRKSARLKYPIPNVPAPKKEPWQHRREGDPEQWTADGHLAGGVGWGFESPNIVESVFTAPRSNAGRVRDLSLTPLGGYGNVRGLFDSRRTAIEATVALGRTHFFALERVGRIGALWNKAKHVIIYRREVVPAGQFYNEDPIGKQQDEHAGRVVVRKWEEYVEILQPQRSYPDLADAADRTGFVLGSHFHSQRIRVDSRWGSDVPGAGWMVPLWKSVFRTLKVSTEDSPAAIYPMPQISLVCAGRSGQEHQQEIRFPENLVFFSSTRLGETDDTDAWAVTEGIDWADELWPEVPTEGGSGSQPYDTKLAKPVIAPAEHGRFVMELIRGEPVAVAHGYDDEPPVAAIDSVTISRASPLKMDQAAPTPKILGALDELRMLASDTRAVVTNLKREVEAAPIATATAQQRGELARRSREAKNTLDGLKKAAARLNDGGATSARNAIDSLDAHSLVEQGCSEVKRLLRMAIDSRLEAAKQEVTRFADRLDIIIQEADAKLSNADQGFEETAKQLSLEIDGAFAIAWTMLDRIEFAGLEVGSQASSRIATVRDEVARMYGLFDRWKDAQADACDMMTALLAQAGTVAGSLAEAFSRECLSLAASAEALRAHGATIQLGLANAIRAAETRASDVPETPPAVRQKFTAVVLGAKAIQQFIDEQLAVADSALLSWITVNATTWATLPADQIEAVKTELQARIIQANEKMQKLQDNFTKALGELAHEAALRLDNLSAFVDALASKWPNAIAAVRSGLERLRAEIRSGLVRCANLPSEQVRTARTFLVAARSLAAARRQAAEQTLTNGAAELTAGSMALAEAICAELSSTVGGWKTELVNFLDSPAFDAIAGAAGQIAGKIEAAAGSVAAEIAAMEAATDAAIGNLANVVETKRAELGRLIGAAERATSKAESVLQKGDRTLSLMRAVGDPPRVEMLDFNRPGVAYVFNALEQRGVRLSPVVAQVNRAASTVAAVGQASEALNDLLSEFGLRIPFRELGNKLTPDSLKDFDLSRIFPQMGGLDLRDLLGGEKFPALDGKYGEAIQISHDFKPEEGRAWFACKVNTPLEETAGKPRRLFALGPVQLDLLKGHFGADARFDASLERGTSKKITGAITGDWEITAFGTRLVTFVDTGLRFDDGGRFDFDVQADRIRLADALQSIVQLLKTFGGQVASKVKPIERDGRIVGMTAPFTLSIGDLEFGAFSVSGIQINCEFTVIVSPEFVISVRTDVNSKMSPFTLSVGTMIGGGYLTANTHVVPSRGEVTQRMSIAVMAGIGRSLNVAGVARGHGYLQFGIEVELCFSTRNGGVGGAIIAFVIASGNLVILGMVNCNITLRLETRYDTSGGASASGQLSVHIPISYFYTLHVERAAEYRLSGGGGGSYADNFA
ncbi:hypothetical protein [Rhizobium sp. WYCCWR10014]|uniref:hypothetical protein n=1 Tax=Rhizobium sp. WYCCWR10014 TaxID=1825933 RepID=UPI0012E72351|nr:hypothetical protein [Rhizobium sp. WYCCWR10014]